MRYILTVLFLIIASSSANSQEILLEDLDVQSSPRLRAYVKEQNISMGTPVRDLLNIEDDKVRWSVYAEVGGAIRNENDLNKKVALTDLFVQGLQDERVEDYVANRLRLPLFEGDYFSEEAKGIILNLEAGDVTQSHCVKILAIADIQHPDIDTEALSQREKTFTSESTNLFFEATQADDIVFYHSPVWASVVVEARAGNPDALERVLNDINQSEKVRLATRPYVVEDLGFIRQPEAVDLLVDFLFSDVPSERTKYSGDAGYVPLPYRAAKALSMCLADYPFDYWDVFTHEQVQQAREFISNYEGPWRIIGKDVPQELSVEETVAPEPIIPEVSSDPEPVAVEEIDVPAEEPVVPQQEEEPEGTAWWIWGLLAIVVIIVVAAFARKSKS